MDIVSRILCLGTFLAIAASATSQAIAGTSDASKQTSDGVQEGATAPYLAAAVKHYNRAVELHQSGFFDQAVEEYNAAVHADSRVKEAWSNLGLIYLQQRSYTEAADALKKALAVYEKYMPLSRRESSTGWYTDLCRLASVYSVQGNYSEAEALYEQAVAVDHRTDGPGHPETLDQYAALLRKMGRAAEADKIEARAKALKTKGN